MVRIGSIELGEFPLLLAPMEDVSDPPFRYVCKQNGADLMYTEFIPSEGLIRDAQKSIQKLDIFDYERPMGIQLYGSEISSMVRAVQIALEAKPDLIDINYGCPVKKVACKGAGAGLLQDIPKMVKMTEEIIRISNVPVTVKTRLGWDDSSKNILEVAERLQDIGIAALAIHGRTRAQLYKGPADWTLIGDVKKNPRMKIPIFGNGDVDTPQKAKEMRERYGVDGVMIGRGSIGNPWIFREIRHFMISGQLLAPPTMEERVENCRTHLMKAIEWKGEKLGILETRRHYANYFKGLPDIRSVRSKLVTSESLIEIMETLDDISLRKCSPVLA